MQEKEFSKNIPLCVDLDGTLLIGDMLHENILYCLKEKPFNIISSAIKAYGAFRIKEDFKAFLKYELSKEYDLNPETLLYNQKVIEFIKKRKELGSKIYLVTATNEKVAKVIFDHFDFFDDYIASNEELNLKGKNKRDSLVERFGEKKFDYIGNDKSDLIVWKSSNNSYGVDCNFDVLSQAKALEIDLDIIVPKESIEEKRRSIIKSLRVHQWVKNLLVFIAPLMAHLLFTPLVFFQTLLSFFIFSLGASAIYQLNDLLDISSDRIHRTKKNRPIASGKILPKEAIYLTLTLLGIAFFLSLLLPGSFLLCFFSYILLTTIYSLKFKSLLILDIITLAMLYCLRIFSGASASGIELSHWLLSFSLFIFFSLACVKRFSELSKKYNSNIKNNVISNNSKGISGRAYRPDDKNAVFSLGVSSGALSVLILALYMNSQEILKLYSKPYILWMLLPVFLYWISRLWILVSREEVSEDPIIFAIKDKTSYVVAIISFLLIYFAS